MRTFGRNFGRWAERRRRGHAVSSRSLVPIDACAALTTISKIWCNLRFCLGDVLQSLMHGILMQGGAGANQRELEALVESSLAMWTASAQLPVSKD
jgi:hypothetical protein